MNRHRLAEARSIALHRAIAAKLAHEPQLLERARQRTREWRSTTTVAEPYVSEWQRILALPLPELCAALVDPGEHARALRQVTPFAGALDARERWRIWKSIQTP